MAAADRPIRPREPDAKAVPDGAAFCMFETAIGTCAIAWRGERIVRTLLPDPQLRERVAALLAGATEARPSAMATQAIERIRALLAGGTVGFADVALDLDDSPAFERSVWQAAAAIPAGETRSYGEIAAAIGQPGAARAVGRALGRNPLPIIIPCHRVLASAGRSGGFSAPGGASTKMKMLGIENARRGGEAMLFDRLDWALKPD
jgi:methylated-DNA-[protein]-cysteine S-methyltransferase